MGLASPGFCLKLSKVEQKWKMCYADGIMKVNRGAPKPDSVLLLRYFLDWTCEESVYMCA